MSLDGHAGPLPHEIRDQKTNQPLYRCVTCRADKGLFWWNGTSVPMCHKPECRTAWNERCAREQAAEDSYNEYGRELHGDAWDRGYRR
jgi:hypothetical protein